MRDLAAKVLPLGLISPLLKQAQVQGEKELKCEQAKIALELLQDRDKRLLSYLSGLSLNSVKIDKIQYFLQQENQVLNKEINLEEEAWLEIKEEGLKQLDNLLKHLLPIQIKIAREYLNELKYLEADIDDKQRQLAVAAPPEAYEKLDKALKDAQQELGYCQGLYEAGKRKSDEIERALTKTKKELKIYSEQALDLQNNEHIIKSATKVQKTLQLFRERLTLKKLNKLEEEVTECFRYLLHKSDLVHRVAIDTDNF